MTYTLTLITEPTGEPLTAAEAKLYARVEDFAEATPSSDTDLIDNLITVARAEVEGFGLALVEQTWDMAIDAFPSCILLPRAPLRSVTYIKYYDDDGTLQTLSAAKYTVDTAYWPPRIVPAYGESWPATRAIPNAVVVRFIAGYSPTATPTDIPQPIRQFLREYVSAKYWGKEIPENTYRLLDKYVLYYR